MLLKSEKYTDENGEERIKDCYGEIVDGVEIVTSTRDRIAEEPSEVEPVAPEPSQLDRIENNLALLTEDTAEYKAFYEAAKEILPEGSDA